MNTDTKELTNLEAQLAEEIPCGECGREAFLCSRGHRCPVEPGPFYKCLSCWQTWLNQRLINLERYGRLRCQDCDQDFPSVEAFSDYRPF